MSSLHVGPLSFPNHPPPLSSPAFRLNQQSFSFFHTLSYNKFFVGSPDSSLRVKASPNPFFRGSSNRFWRHALLESSISIHGGGNNNNDDNGNHNNGGGGDDDGFEMGGGNWDWKLCGLLIFAIDCMKNKKFRHRVLLLCWSLGCWHLAFLQKQLAFAKASLIVPGNLWELKGGKWVRLVPDACSDAFVVDETFRGKKNDGENCADSPSSSHGEHLRQAVSDSVRWCRGLAAGLMLPEGYPESVSSDYLEYSLWRALQSIASQVNGVLTTQALLYAVGLGKGAIPTAAAINWVIKDGIGYLSKIMLSKYGRHFDVHPRGWRLFADLLENAAYGLELLTPAFPELFVLIGAVAGASRSASSMIQAATRSCFCAGFAAQRNFAEVIAKGEAQGMVSKSIGMMLGIALANYVASSGPLTAATFGVVTAVHMFCNVKSYQSIQLRSLNPYRASLVFSEYLLSGQVPSVKEVNDEEPICSGMAGFRIKSMQQEQTQFLSEEAKQAAARINCRLQLGTKLSEIVRSKDEVVALFGLFKNEGYILTEKGGKYCVVLKEGCTPIDMLKSIFHVNYMYWLEQSVGIDSRGAVEDCKAGGKIKLSYEYVQREFGHATKDSQDAGWYTDGLVARPLSYRIALR